MWAEPRSKRWRNRVLQRTDGHRTNEPDRRNRVWLKNKDFRVQRHCDFTQVDADHMADHAQRQQQDDCAGERERKSVAWGKSVLVCVDIGGGRIIEKKKHDRTSK